MQPFSKMANVSPSNANIKDATLRDFSGGLIASQPDTIMESRYSVERVNFIENDDYALQLRFGTKLFATFASAIVGSTYLATRIVVVCADGTIHTIDAAGVTTVIWNSAIAGALPGAPAGWTATSRVDFTEVSGELLVFNGVNKPVIIDGDYTAVYLNDPSTGSNVNTPIADFCTTVGDYCVAAEEDDPEIYISASGTAKVWVGDPAPNDAIRLNLGAYVKSQSRKITGLQAHSNLLYVFFNTSIVIIKLGNFDESGAHRPTVIDVINETGTLNHNTNFSHPDGLVTLCLDGIYIITTNVFGKYERRGIFDNIFPIFSKNFPTTGAAIKEAFIHHDRLQSNVLFFYKSIKNERMIFAYNYKQRLLSGNWANFSNWDFVGGLSTLQKRSYFFQGTKLYQYGNVAYDGEKYLTDFIGDAAFETEENKGVPIPFAIESPWMDANQRLRLKELVYVTGESTGDARFMLDIFVDKYYKDVDGNLDPAGQIEFVAGSGGGFGLPSDGYGGSRRFSDERYHRLPLRFKIFKYRISGEATKEFFLTSLSFIYKLAGYRR